MDEISMENILSQTEDVNITEVYTSTNESTLLGIEQGCLRLKSECTGVYDKRGAQVNNTKAPIHCDT